MNCMPGPSAQSTAAPSLGRSALLERARAATDDPDLTARIDLTLAYAEAETGHASTGIARCTGLLAQDLDARREGWSGPSWDCS